VQYISLDEGDTCGSEQNLWQINLEQDNTVMVEVIVVGGVLL
jgi:hypothetical protein